MDFSTTLEFARAEMLPRSTQFRRDFIPLCSNLDDLRNLLNGFVAQGHDVPATLADVELPRFGDAGLESVASDRGILTWDDERVLLYNADTRRYELESRVKHSLAVRHTCLAELCETSLNRIYRTACDEVELWGPRPSTFMSGSDIGAEYMHALLSAEREQKDDFPQHAADLLVLWDGNVIYVYRATFHGEEGK